MANVIVSALATWNGKALKKAKSDVSVFDKQLKSLARTFGVTFSAAAVVAFSKNAVKAFAAEHQCSALTSVSRKGFLKRFPAYGFKPKCITFELPIEGN